MQFQFTSMRPWIFCAIAARFFVDGSEEFFITPSAWYYIKSLGQTMVFLGIVLSAYPIGAVLTGSVVGKFADKFGHIKFILLASFTMKVLGNLIYSIPLSAYFPLAGRFLSGLAEGSAGVYYGQIILYTPEEHRARIFIFLDSMYALGSLFGPAVSVFLSFNVNILGWKIYAGNSPGIVLALIWLVLLVNAMWFPSEFGTKKTTIDDDPDHDENNDNDDDDVYYNDDIISTENLTDPPSYASRSTVLLIFYQVFLSLFYSTTVTFYVPLLAQELLHLQLVEVRLLFLVGSVFSMVSFLLLYLGASYFHETQLLACSMLMQVVAIFIFTFFGFSWDNARGVYDSYILLAYICLGVQFFGFCLCCSLLSKVTDPNDAAFYQGSSFAALHSGFVVSRIVSSFIFTKTSVLWFCLALVIMWTLGAVWLMIEYRNLTKPRNIS